ncbi:MAG TPA: hypothetical protein V6D26_30040 [Stenomitos sp.]|jgi:hypothetical protein
MTIREDWNPDSACIEMAELFNQADKIINQPHYREDVSADELDTPSADSLQTTAVNESQGLTTLCPNQFLPQHSKT